MMDDIARIVDAAYERRAELTPARVDAETREAVGAAIEMLDTGAARVAERRTDGWHVNDWLKKAVLLWFRMQPNRMVTGHGMPAFDRAPLKYTAYDAERFAADGVRVVPGAIVRKGACVERDVVLMPSFVNVGARIGAGTMVDTWATVGSCAQIGRHVHLSGGVGIGGVLEPVQAAPTIIEDGCFIGARSEVVEGVIVEEGAVLAMGVYIGQSTRIYDRARDEVSYGRVPAGAVVVPGTLPGSDGRCALACAVIVKRVDARTRERVGINELLRGV
jgi:2,3,4,5-tetrahydropyridine-2-carboxylate N-succinyltransferase